MSEQPAPSRGTPGTPGTTASRRAPEVLPALSPGEVDVLGALADAELSSFLRLAARAPTGPTLGDVEGLSGIAVGHFDRYRAVRDHLDERGVEPRTAMEPFRSDGEAFHRRLAPSTWSEALLGAYVGDGIATDFLVQVSAHAQTGVTELVSEHFGAPLTRSDGSAGSAPRDPVLEAFVVEGVERAVESDAQLRSRLSLWGRRLVGEALGQAQALLVDRPGLEGLLAGPRQRGPGAPMPVRAPIAEVFSLITAAHVARMARLGLTA